ncbi:MAG: hypothetical protein AAF567_12795 [Actinomycetota bacterium]
MASRRGKRKKQDIDPLGGFTLEQLMSLEPIVVVEKKQSLVGRIIGAPFRLVGGLLKVPVRLVVGLIKVPLRVIKAVLPPYRRS